jgi:RNA polymerase-binding transcription factor DksA
MSVQAQSVIEEFQRRLQEARREVWRTVVRTDEELATLETHQAGAPMEDAGTIGVAAVLAELDGLQRHRLDEIDAAQARLAAGTYGACERCAVAIPLARLRALPTARLCVDCERQAEHPPRG